MNYYNEFDPYASEWLKNLIKEGFIPNGEVDTRSIVDVEPNDLKRFTQCHFFAGIAGWSLALKFAGWADDRQIWTGSCPCQPFSVAGKGKGKDDERHLWPRFFRLISACRPAVVMGEQVAGKAGYDWLDGVRSDLEGQDYACTGVDIPACAVNAPHIRQRLYWVASSLMENPRCGEQQKSGYTKQMPVGRDGEERSANTFSGSGSHEFRSTQDGIVVNANGAGQREHGGAVAVQAQQPSVECAGGDAFSLADADSQSIRGRLSSEVVGSPGGNEDQAQQREWVWADIGADSINFWNDAEWLTGADGKTRRSKPGICLLANGVPARVGKLRAFGNAIVPQVAGQVIRSFMEVHGEQSRT